MNENIKKHLKSPLAETIQTVAIALFIALLVRSVLTAPYKIPTGSMIPTLVIGDHIFVSKLSYGLKLPFTNINIIEYDHPNVGDIIVFKYPKDERVDYVKRVVGVGGDTLELRDNYLYINGKKMDLKPVTQVKDDNEYSEAELFEENLMGVKHIVQYNNYSYSHFDFGPITVPEGNVFVIGDNRDNSADSRVWGYVPLKNIRGKAHIVWFSRDKESFGIRVNRLFKLIK